MSNKTHKTWIDIRVYRDRSDGLYHWDGIMRCRIKSGRDKDLFSVQNPTSGRAKSAGKAKQNAEKIMANCGITVGEIDIVIPWGKQ